MSHGENPKLTTAITASEFGQDEESIVVAAKWLIDRFPDEKKLLSVADKKHFEQYAVFEVLRKKYGFNVDTRNKTPRSSFDGVILADYIHGDAIFKIPRSGAKAIAVVPAFVFPDRKSGKSVNASKLQPWALGTGAELLGGDSIKWVTREPVGGNTKPQVITPLSGVSRDIVEGMTEMIYGSMMVDNSLDKDKVVGPLLGLKKQLGSLDRDAIETFLWSTDWSSSNIEKTLEFIDKINDGKSLKIRGRTIQPVDYSGRF